MSFVRYPSIEQFRNVVKSVAEHYKHKYGQRDEAGELILAQPKTWTLPKIEFTGTVKLHGSNGAIVYNVEQKKLDFQSRNNTLNIQNDNADFAYWGHQHREELTAFMEKTVENFKSLSPDFGPEQVVIFGEWCGGNIQKGVGISGLPKMFVIFEFWIQLDNGKDESLFNWHLNVNEMDISIPSIYKITDFKTYKIDIDFERPELSQNELSELTMQVEADCPVARIFKPDAEEGSLVGEGIVWSYDFDNGSRMRFKVKGEKHSASKVKTLASVDVEKIKAATEFADFALTESRLNQGLEYLNEQGFEKSAKSTGHFVKWISSDVFKEELDTITDNGLDPKLVGKEVSNKARQWFFTKI